MNPWDHAVASRTEGALRDHDSGEWPCLVTPTAERATAPTSPPPEVAAMIEVGELLRSASSPRDVFAHLVEIVDRVLPSRAIAIAPAPRNSEPLVWTRGAPGLESAAVALLAESMLDYFHDDAELGEVALPQQQWVALPIAADDGTLMGVFALAPADAVDEANVAFAASVARHLANLFARTERLRHVFAAREHAEWMARTSDLRFIEERRARTAAERSLRILRTASDATAVLLSTFDYRSALRHVARILATDLASGCVFDVDEELGLERIAHVPARAEGVVASGLSELVGNVIRYRSAVATARVSPSVPDGDARSRVVAAQARRALGVDWIVSVPISTDGASVLGVLTLFGSTPDHAPLPISVVEELARRAAVAIENGRLYLAAIEAARQREQVLSMVSHDLKNSFCVILMSVARVLEGMPEVERRHRGRSQLELIERSARRMMKLVADLVDVAAIDAGRISVMPRPCAVRELVLEVFEELSAQAKAAGVELTCEVPDELPPVQADAHRLTQVLTNLVGNAIKFTAAGGSVSARATVTDGKAVAVSIVDTGVGIPAAHLAHVFDRFWQGPTGKAGSGLGLAICRGLVERSGGRIWAKSSPGLGTTMTFTLPLGA